MSQPTQPERRALGRPARLIYRSTCSIYPLAQTVRYLLDAHAGADPLLDAAWQHARAAEEALLAYLRAARADGSLPDAVQAIASNQRDAA